MPISRDEVIRILIEVGVLCQSPSGQFTFTTVAGELSRAQQLRPVNKADLAALIKVNGGTLQGIPLYAEVRKNDRPVSSTTKEYIDLLWLDVSGKVCISPLDLQSLDLTGADLRGADLRGADLRNSHLWQVNLQQTDLWKAKLQGAYLWRAEFDESTRFEGADWGDFILGEETDQLYDEATTTYRRLMVWHREKGLYAKEERFHYREWVSWRRSLWKQGKHFEAIWHLAMEEMFGYGVKYNRVVRSGLVILLGFALIYYLTGLYDDYSFTTFLRALYFSGVSFTAIGYGGWVKDDLGWPKYIGAVEALLGVFFVALFLVSFTRRWTK